MTRNSATASKQSTLRTGEAHSARTIMSSCGTSPEFGNLVVIGDAT